jgi:hypothetical protein
MPDYSDWKKRDRKNHKNGEIMLANEMSDNTGTNVALGMLR